MTDDSEFDEEGWDEAYAELINGLQEADVCRTRSHPLLIEVTSDAGEKDEVDDDDIDDDFKFPAETVSKLNDRIQRTTESPYEIFRRRRRRAGVLSVRVLKGRLLNVVCCRSQIWFDLTGVGHNFVIPSRADEREKQKVSCFQLASLILLAMRQGRVCRIWS